MNRYRSTPGLGPVKASPQTTCQKCLKKGHYSFECKASLQERPYASRPSRSTLFKNPKLVQPLESEKENAVMGGSGSGIEVEGMADRVLGEREAMKKAEAERSGIADGNGSEGRQRHRSSSVDSVSTISTNQSRSRSPDQRTKRYTNDQDEKARNSRTQHRSTSSSPDRSHARKRRHNSQSSSSETRSPNQKREPGSQRKSRRHRTVSPDDRGRPHDYRRGSRRSRSHSGSMEESFDRSQINKQRKLLSDDEDEDDDDDEPGNENGYRPGRGQGKVPGRKDGDDYHQSIRSEKELNRRGRDGHVRNDVGRANGGGKGVKARKERSLSPYSRRLALTQAMNFNR